LIVDAEPLSRILSRVRERLEGVSETGRLDAQVLVAHVLGRSRSWIMAHPEAILTSEQRAQVESALARLVFGEPLPYVLGWWEFYGMEFKITPAVLIPRPETELLVETALDWLGKHPGARLGIDVGTGSGCIAVVLARKTPDLRMLACDVSHDALLVAKSNVTRYQMDSRVYCLQADLLPWIYHGSAYPERFDLICANLPYVPSGTLAGLRVSKSEPVLALDGGTDGLDTIRQLLEVAPGRLVRPGLLLIEIEASQRAEAQRLARSAFPRAGIDLLDDLAGKNRLVCVRNEP
jgi:release factor glutamine methyltransferase